MDDDQELAVPQAVTRLWDRVKEALREGDNPSPQEIDRLAASLGMKLAASTITGWFQNWSVVPAWEKFEVLIKALAAEQDEDWRSLHLAALKADRELKREERRRKDQAQDSIRQPPSARHDQTPVTSADPLDQPPSRSDAPAPAKDRAGFWTTRRKVIAVVVTVAAVIALAVVLAWVSRQPGHTQSGAGTSAAGAPQGTTELSGQPGAPSARNCAYVAATPAPVYPQPNSGSQPIKFKQLNDRVEVVAGHHPSGWILVRTPRDPPGSNWMQTSVLTSPAPCTAPLPGDT